MSADQGPRVSALFATVVSWAVAAGAKRIDLLPGVWRGETDEWKVAVNPHKHEIDGILPGQMVLEHKTYMAFAALGLNGGAITGASEPEIIAHFNAAREAAEAEARG